MTAAHCVGRAKVPSGPITSSFRDWNGRLVAQGGGTYHITELRFPIQNGYGGASTDIAVLKIPKKADILDHAGSKVPQPVLYDGNAELYNIVWFAGYGRWGAGTGGPNGSYFPLSGPRRAAAASSISRVFENEHGLGANFEPATSANYWSRSAPGDSGSAWWQQFNGRWTIVATTNGGTGTLSTGARVSKYVAFIANVYPDALFLSAALKRGSATPAVSTPVITPNGAPISPFGK
ncbi:trypsin-like serine protease [Paraburkholderia fungorum]